MRRFGHGLNTDETRNPTNQNQHHRILRRLHHLLKRPDAEAAGRVPLAMMKHANADTLRELLQMADMEPKRF
jgi:hypothetical protein